MYDFELEKEGVEYLDPLLDQGWLRVAQFLPPEATVDPNNHVAPL